MNARKKHHKAPALNLANGTQRIPLLGIGFIETKTHIKIFGPIPRPNHLPKILLN